MFCRWCRITVVKAWIGCLSYIVCTSVFTDKKAEGVSTIFGRSVLFGDPYIKVYVKVKDHSKVKVTHQKDQISTLCCMKLGLYTKL